MQEQLKRMRRRAMKEGALALVMYVAVLSLTLVVLRKYDLGALKYAVTLAPMLPCVLGATAILHAMRGMDEMQRKIQLDALAFAFAVTAFVTFSYGFLENVGFPMLSWFNIWPLMAVLWMVGLMVSRLRYR